MYDRTSCSFEFNSELTVNTSLFSERTQIYLFIQTTTSGQTDMFAFKIVKQCLEMDLKILFENRLQQIEKLENFVILYGKKGYIISNLRETVNETEQIKEFLSLCMSVLEKFQKENQERFTKLIHSSRQLSTLMLHTLASDFEHQFKQIGQSAEEKQYFSPVLTEITNAATPTSCRQLYFKPGDRLSLADYMKSPYTTKKIRPLALQFIDFLTIVSIDAFKMIPG